MNIESLRKRMDTKVVKMQAKYGLSKEKEEPKWIPWQKQIMESKESAILLCGGYGSGKSFVGFAKFMRWMEEGEGNGIITGFSFNTIMSLLLEMNGELGTKLNLNAKDSRIRYKNRYIFVYGMDTVRSKSRIRGINAEVWWGDEIVLQDEDAVNEVLARLRVGNPKYILSTNPDNMDNFVYKRFFDKIKTYTIQTGDNTSIKDLKGYIERIGYIEGSRAYARYILGEWGELDDSIFADIEIVDNFQGGKRFAVIDPSLVDNGDFTAVAVGVRDGDRIIISGELFQGSWYNSMEKILVFLRKYDVDFVYVEDNVVGSAFTDLVFDKFRLIVDRIRTTRNKVEKISSIAGAIGLKKLVFYKDMDYNFKQQCLGWSAKNKGRDDAPDAVSMVYLKMEGLKT